MCGIVGYFNSGNNFVAPRGEMTDAIVHRGPDDVGWWSNPIAGIALGHRRLSILDLSPAGHQPMHSACGRYVLVFNGEVYNHLEIRAELTELGIAPEWKGHSDTETLLAGFVRWGVVETLKKSTGMFAIALWDKETRKLVLARDRMGEKPLYYGFADDALVFASELKALGAYPGFRPVLNRDALPLYLRHGYIPAPLSVYRGIFKLTPGTWVEFDAADIAARRMPAPRAYWSMACAVEAGLSNGFSGSPSEAVDELERLLLRSVRDQMISDVPLGAFLSGGVDSSAIVALMQAQSSRPVKTFTIGFSESGYNEAEYAKAVAKHLGTEHHELYVTSQDALNLVPNLSHHWDEPFADASQIPTYMVCAMAKKHVTVCLSGDAGDELFAGYTRYAQTEALWNRLSRIPGPLRNFATASVQTIPVGLWQALLGPVGTRFGGEMWRGRTGDKIHKLAELLREDSLIGLYRGAVSSFKTFECLNGAPSGATPESPWKHPLTDRLSGIGAMSFIDTLTYLPDDILTKVDRAAMAVSLEGRIPMLDHRVVEFAWSLPDNLKVREGKSKWILREVLFRHVPRELIERPKQGFGVPVGQWLRGPLREWAEELLNESRLREDGVFDADVVGKLWEEHQSGTRNWEARLWNLLMFQAWLRDNPCVVLN